MLSVALATAAVASGSSEVADPWPTMRAFSAAFVASEVSRFQNHDLGASSIRDMAAAAWALLNSAYPLPPSPANVTAAVGMLELVFSRQLSDGQWPWTWSSSQCTDTNAVQFTAFPIARTLLAYGGLMPAGWVDAHSAALVRAAEASWAEGSSPTSEAQPHYTNIATMRIGVLTLVGQLTRNATIAARAAAALSAWTTLVAAANIHEYSSPTYTAVSLHNILATAADVDDSVTAATLQRFANFLWTSVAAVYWAPAAEMGGAHSRDYDYVGGAAGMDWAYALSGLASAGGVPGGGDAFVLNYDPITQTELLVAAVRGDLRTAPPAALDLAAPPAAGAWRVARASFAAAAGAGPDVPAVATAGSDSYLFTSRVVTLGSSSLYYNAQDKQVVAQLAVAVGGAPPAAAPRLAQVTLVQDTWDAPYGRNRSGLCGIDAGKPTHAKATVASVQDLGLLLTIQDLSMTIESTSRCGPFTSVSTSVVFPAGRGVDGVYVNGVRVSNTTRGAPNVPLALGDTVAVRSAGGVVAFRIPFVDRLKGFTPVSAIKFDGPVGTDAARLVVYLYQGPPTSFPASPEPSRSITVMGVGNADSDADAAAFTAALSSLRVTNEAANLTNWRVTLSPAAALREGTSAPLPHGFSSTLSAALYVPREKRILARNVNGTAMPMPRAGFLEVLHSDGTTQGFTP